MNWQKADRAAVLVAAATQVATVFVAMAVPNQPPVHFSCNDDALHYLFALSFWYFLIRYSWKALKALNNRMERFLATRSSRSTRTSKPLAPPKSF